ncbi:hypothetical protein K5I29_03055 [Flavobacterium agricola]|uniref:Uncharacterized protein n=1 Tax=Flavobacterium agricola TaxID=2870839 RepID=A0ABY6M036_9FLAO|nr:hypothetical protein [Flavobacterium agricola]UYW01909.1 hypothetical protein K5I29_03055 [Flavobacterium agricola]
MKFFRFIKKYKFPFSFIQNIFSNKQAIVVQQPELTALDLDNLLQEFVFLTEADEFNEPKTVQEFIANSKYIKNNLDDYFKLLIEEGCADEVANFNEAAYFQYVLSSLLFTYEDDWKQNYQSLSDYITNETGQEFTISAHEVQNGPETIAKKLEQETDYTLMNVAVTETENSFFICLKNRKNKIVALAKQLNFPIVNY